MLEIVGQYGLRALIKFLFFKDDDSLIINGIQGPEPLRNQPITYINQDDEEETVLRNLKTTISASLKSIDVSIRSGSITSISSGKSFVSNFSVKSDSGISLPAKPKQTFVQELPKVQEQPIHPMINPTISKNANSKYKLGRRPWESEPMLASLKKKVHKIQRYF